MWIFSPEPFVPEKRGYDVMFCGHRDGVVGPKDQLIAPQVVIKRVGVLDKTGFGWGLNDTSQGIIPVLNCALPRPFYSASGEGVGPFFSLRSRKGWMPPAEVFNKQ